MYGKDGVLRYDRAHGKKPWADMFEKESQERQHGHAQLTSAQFHVQRAMTIISSKFAKVIREKLRSKHLKSNRRNVSDVSKPSPMRNWDQVLNSQAFCDLCGKPSVSRCAFCITCGCVAHRLCVAKSSMYTIITKKEAPGAQYYECRHCHETAQEEQKFYDESVAKIKRVNAQISTQQVIDEHIIAQRMQAHAKLVKESVILIQSTLRKHRARQIFYMWRRTQLRVVVLEMNDVFPLICPPTSSSLRSSFDGSGLLSGNGTGAEPDDGESLPPGFVVVTVIDPIKHLQIMRVEKKLQLTPNEAFLLPGISALMQVVVTVFIRDPTQAFSFTKQTNIMIGQVVLALRDTHNFLLPHTYKSISISKKVTWLPLPITAEKVNVEINTLYSNGHGSNLGYVLCTNTTPNYNSFTSWVVKEHNLDHGWQPKMPTRIDDDDNDNDLRKQQKHESGDDTVAIASVASSVVTGIEALNVSNNSPSRLLMDAPDTSISTPPPASRIVVRPKSAHPSTGGKSGSISSLFKQKPSQSQQTNNDAIHTTYMGQWATLGGGNKVIWSRPTSAVTRGMQQSRPGSATPPLSLPVRPGTAGATRSKVPSVWEGKDKGKDNNKPSSKFPSVTGKYQLSQSQPPTPISISAGIGGEVDNSNSALFNKTSQAHKKLDVKNFLESTYHTCTLRYIPLNPISNMCAKVLGPPIDALRKVPLVSFRKSNSKSVAPPVVTAQSNTAKRSTHYWLVLADLWLYFFLSHNDASARLMGDIKDADVYLERNARGEVLHIRHVDSREWQFEFEDEAKAVKFNFAINEAQNAMRTGESIYMQPPRSGDIKPFGYAGCHVR